MIFLLVEFLRTFEKLYDSPNKDILFGNIWIRRPLHDIRSISRKIPVANDETPQLVPPWEVPKNRERLHNQLHNHQHQIQRSSQTCTVCLWWKFQWEMRNKHRSRIDETSWIWVWNGTRFFHQPCHCFVWFATIFFWSLIFLCLLWVCPERATKNSGHQGRKKQNRRCTQEAYLIVAIVSFVGSSLKNPWNMESPDFLWQIMKKHTF